MLAVHDRGRLPFAALHGEPVHVHAWRALAAAAERLGCPPPVVLVAAEDRAEVLEDLAALAGADATGRSGSRLAPELADPATWHPQPGTAVLVHDALCPLTPVDFLVEVGTGAVAGGAAAVGCRPVTDTVKVVEDDRIDATVDRDGLVAVAAPALVPARSHGGAPLPTARMVDLLAWLRDRGEVTLAKAPSMARRVEDISALVVLESIDELAGRVRTGPRQPTR